MLKIVKEGRGYNLETVKKKFINICNTTGREHIPYECDLDNWTLRDYISEAQYQADMRKEEWYDSLMRQEWRIYARFIDTYSKYLTDDVKCVEKHSSKWD